MKDSVKIISEVQIDEFEEREEETLQLAENSEIEQNQRELVQNEFEEKRALLQKTKIVRQTWSISEIFQKRRDNKLILDPDYQRRVIWNNEKKTAFIESLYMEIMIPPIYVEKTTQMLSSILDIYVITANSPEFTKYDIFARLNRGAEKLKVNEIRRAIYKSKATMWITDFVDKQLNENKEAYETIFSDNDIKRYEDYGRLYKSVAFYLRSDKDVGIVRGYNSRPRDLINNVLQELQKGKITIKQETLNLILNQTLFLREKFSETPNVDYIIDSIIPFVECIERDRENRKIAMIFEDEKIRKTLEKSPATTSNVNARLKRVKELLVEK